MKEEAQDKDTPSKRSRPTNAEMEARRKEAADAWLATGNPLEDVEKLVNACSSCKKLTLPGTFLLVPFPDSDSRKAYFPDFG